MTVQSTSTTAYLETAESREILCKRLHRLYERHVNGLTDREAGRLLNLHPSQVSARRNDLGSIVYNRDEETRRDPFTRKSGKVWRLVTREPKQLQLI
jgi:hypothetical protein